MSCDPRCCPCHGHESSAARRGSPLGRLVGTVLSVLFLYGTLIFGSGTLIRTGHPVAVETGRLIQTVTLVEPAIHWARSNGHDALAGGLTRLSEGLDLS